MVVPAFGFSAGDFVDVIGLISKAAKALREIDEHLLNINRRFWISRLIKAY